jgi:hypothetical protein
MTTTQERYHEMLMARVREDRYPSAQLLDRIEGMLVTPQQLVDYMELLVDKIDESHYPSRQLLDRAERMFSRVAAMQA